MSSHLLHLWGPLYIQAYGVMIFIALIITVWRVQKNELFKKIFTKEQFSSLVMRSIFVGFLGGRLLHIISAYSDYQSWHEYFYFWQGGLSILGSVIALSLYIPYYLHAQKIKLGVAVDFLAMYVPLLQSIARFGCLFAGCCYGAKTSMPWAIVYTDCMGTAPCNVPLHPTQLYSAGILFVLFLTLRFGVYPFFKKRGFFGSGLLVCIYLMGASAERFIVDFWRADRVMTNGSLTILSMHQWIAIGIFFLGLLGGIIFFIKNKN